MKNVMSKKIVVFDIMFILICSLFISTSNVVSKDNEIISIEITVNQVEDEIEIIYEINGFVEIPLEVDRVGYSIIRIGEESNLLLVGEPDIPSICRSIVIPDTAKMKIDIISMKYEEFDNILIAPSKGNLLRNVNPDDVPYEFGEIYYEDAWFPGEIASLREPYILRDFRGQVIDVYPIQYNPVKKILRLYNHIKVNIYPDGIDTINIINREKLPDKVDNNYKFIYKTHFINFGKTSRYDPVAEQGNMLIIVYDEFWDEMQPFVEWKTIKGIPTEMVNVSEIGDANATKAYIENYYNDNGLTFVLLVGDADQVPTITADNSASDPSYSYIAGDDHYPDLFIGRFSAQTPDQLNTQVKRSIEYEKTPLPDAEWYHKGAGIGSDEGIGDDGEYDWEHIRNIRSKLLNYTYTEVNELYGGSQGGDDEPEAPTPEMISDVLNNGRSIINYCGHGKWNGWGWDSARDWYVFHSDDVNDLVNDNMLPFVICVACKNGQFDVYNTSFCEAWLRATNNSGPTGAIAATGSSKDTSWSPPMDAQDEMMDLLVESYTDNVKHTIGGIHYNGCMHMNDEYGSDGYSETDAWHVFGDPSLQIRTDSPVEMTVACDDEIKEGATMFEVTVLGVKDALCALSRNGELWGYAYTDETGYALIELDEPVVGKEPLDLVVTAYNKIPYIAEVFVFNDPPDIPNKPDGPTKGQPYKEYTFTTSTTDPNRDQVSYMWRWGDGHYSEWSDPYNSGETTSASHRWSEVATYKIRVKARDAEGAETDWSEPLSITITKSKNRVSQNLLFFKIFQELPEHFPLLERLLSFLF